MRIYEIVLSIPHGSTYIPEALRKRMPHPDEVLLQEPDLYTDRIYNIKGPKIVEATASRIISDVNRAPDEIYTIGQSRSMGVIILSTSNQENVFETDPSFEEMQEWIAEFHAPFHKELHRALNGSRFLIDCHSMWSVSPSYREDKGTLRPDIVLGNRQYTTCDAQTTKYFRDAFLEKGYTVAINKPFIGRYVVGTHCSRNGTPGIQLEINRNLYMNEETLEPDEAAITRLNQEFREIVEGFCLWSEEHKPSMDLCDLSIENPL
ncbi:MAG TPA: N-formylglutamate amidohydrolase [Candidatus Gracilibacteria bacterium]